MHYNTGMSQPTTNYHARSARVYVQLREQGAAARRARYNSAASIAERAAAHRSKAEGHMEWVAAGVSGSVDHAALAEREYQLAYEEETA